MPQFQTIVAKHTGCIWQFLYVLPLYYIEPEPYQRQDQILISLRAKHYDSSRPWKADGRPAP